MTMLSLAELVRKHQMTITGALHVGARLGEEAKDYVSLGVPKVWWVEANSEVLSDLRANVEPHGHVVIHALVTDEDGVETTLHVTNERGLSSSVLPFGSHSNFSPNMVFERDETIPSTTIDTLVASHSIPASVNYLEMDIQGAELMALRGASDFLAQLDAVCAEVNDRDVYLDCAKVWELDELLGASGFERVETYWVADQGWGDAFWLRTGPRA